MNKNCDIKKSIKKVLVFISYIFGPFVKPYNPIYYKEELENY